MKIERIQAHALGVFLSDTNIIDVTVLLNPKEVFRLRRKLFGKNRRPDRKITDGSIKLGRPNYAEKKRINKMAAKDFPKMIVKVAG